MKDQERSRTIKKILATVSSLLILYFVTFPLIWLALTAFKVQRDAFSTKIFFEPTLQNFVRLFDGNPYDFQPLLVNSIIISLTTVLITIPVATMAAYAFSRFVFVGQNLLLIGVLSTQFLPGVVVMLPYYIQFRDLGLLDTRIAVIIMHLAIAIPFAIWLLKGFVDALPTELEEAALVDGASELGVLRFIIVPLLMPGIITATAFSFVLSWNEFLFAFILTSQRARPMMVGLLSLTEMGQIPWEKMSAAGLIIMLPVFVLSLSIRRYFVEGLTMGAVK